MKKIVGLAMFSALVYGFGNAYADEPKENEEFVDTDGAQGKDKSSEQSSAGNDASKNAAIDAIMKKMASKAPKTKREFTTFDMAVIGEIKAIEVNSINFIRLKDKAGQIFVPNPKVADIDVIDDTSLYLTGLQAGTTSLVVQDKQGNIIANYKIVVTYPLSEIQRYLRELYPDTDVEALSMEDNVILKGSVPSPERAADVVALVGRYVDSGKIINKLNIVTATQVMLKVRVAEVSRKVTKSLGIDWRAVSFPNSIDGPVFGTYANSVGSMIEHVSSTDTNGMDTLKTSVLAKEGNGGPKWFFKTGKNDSLSAVLDALATESFAYILAEPTLIALSGQKATFNVGGQYGYTVTQNGNNGANTTEFKDWGTSVEFTPVVISEDRIKLTVKPEVSSIDESQSKEKAAPALSTKKVETTVELGSGQSLAIAGLLQTNKSSINSETPFLADLPLFGPLFRHSTVTKDQKEVIVIVTPYLVKPSSKALKAPTDFVPRMYSPLEVIINRETHKIGGCRGLLTIR